MTVRGSTRCSYHCAGSASKAPACDNCSVVVALSLLLSAVPIAACYALRWWLRRERLQPVWTIPTLVVAGGAGGLFFGLAVSPFFEPWLMTLGMEHTLVAGFAVPLAEEIGKGLGLLLLLATRWFRSP